MNNKNNKLLIICGPTAVGKTNLALYLANKFKGELISADSRQIYKGLDIGTGKDWGDKTIKIWGYDLVEPQDEFSVSHYQKFASKKIMQIQKSNKLPILVGGTGLYINAIANGIDTINVPKDEKLRLKLAAKTVGDLYKMLLNINYKKAVSMNNSDKNNPRRLIRAIEVSHQKPNIINNKNTNKFNILKIGLILDKNLLFKKIESRVEKRIEMGVENEIFNLLKRNVSWNSQSMSSLGYFEWKEYFMGKKTKDSVISDWKKEEKKYAKRQITWFKKDKTINWFNVDSKHYPENVEKFVFNWYHK